MLPPDLASRLRLSVPEQPTAPQPVAPARPLADVLSELIPGQRIMAEIQALLPNGMYRAVVSQRELTLALPFSAKPGDSLELEVVESEGKVSLAFVANRSEGKPAESTSPSVPTTLSQTGRLIGDLLAGVGEEGKRAQPAPLNGNQPLVDRMPATAKDLIPILKDALSKSGMFYEAHQARWAEGKESISTLLEQPQGKLSPSLRGESNPPAPVSVSTPQIPGKIEENSVSSSSTSIPEKASTAATITSPVRSELTPLVQQQLDALASQNYVWQGQVWPGQQMHWEIQEEGQRRSEEDAPERWQTRLQLTLPNLGGVEASIRLRSGKDIEIALVTDSESSHISLSAAASALKQQLEDAGLNLAQWSITHGESTS